MSVDTYGRISGYISNYDVLNYIRHKYDPNAKSYVRTEMRGSVKDLTFPVELYDPTDTDVVVESGFIEFEAYGNCRSLFYYHVNYNCFENLEYYRERGLEDMVKTHTTHVGLGCYGNSEEIITNIVSHFGGGWVDENDCDDEPYHRVGPMVDDKVPPVIRVTMKEIEEKFGGTVVITDYRR